MRSLAERPDMSGAAASDAAVIDLGTVIDLGEDRDPLDDAPATGRRRGWPALVALLALLLSCAVASTGPLTPALRAVGDVELSLADTYAVTADELLLVHSPARGLLSAYELTGGRLRWQTPAPAMSYRLRSGAGLVLLRPRATFDTSGGDPGTIALSAGDGAARWRMGGTVVAVAGAPTVLVVSELNSVPGAGRRVSGTILGVDPVSGHAHWSLDLDTTAILQPVGGVPARALLLRPDGRAELRRLDTGQVVAAGQLPSADYNPENPDVAGGMLLLRHTGQHGQQVSAYDVDTLALQWTRPAGPEVDTVACGTSVCLIGVPGIRAVDPATGVQRWSHQRWQAIEARGDLLLAYGSGVHEDRLVGAVDPVTGRVLVDLSRWRLVPTADPDGDLIVLRRTLGAQGVTRTLVGSADPAARQVRLLGDLPAGADDCRSTAAHLVCRADGRLLIWGFNPTRRPG